MVKVQGDLLNTSVSIPTLVSAAGGCYTQLQAQWTRQRQVRRTHLGLAGRVPGGTLRLLLVRAEQLACLLLHVAGGRLHVAGHCRKEYRRWSEQSHSSGNERYNGQPQISIGKVPKVCCQQANKAARHGSVHRTHATWQKADTWAA
jgi:hypothetical protein